MEKEDILEKSRKENALKDEREKRIEQSAYENAYLAIMGCFVLLGIGATIQKYVTGESFANYRIFMLAVLIGYVGQNFTKYFYTKKKSHLWMGIICIVVSFMTLYSILFFES